MPENNASQAASGAPKRVDSKWVVLFAFLFAVAVFIAIGIGLYTKGGGFLNQLQETAVSRGLITFLVAIVTVSIALIVAVWVIASNAEREVLKERYSYAKDILATLVGILGTILGFYFGSAERSATETLALSELQIRPGQLVAHVSGGTPPFRYTVSGLEQTTARVSKDGWLFEQLPASLKTGTSLTVEVVDAKDRKASRATTYQSQEPNPPAEGGDQRTTQPRQPAGTKSR